MDSRGQKTECSDLVILLPGLMGSVLARGDDEIWTTEARGVVATLFRLGRALKSLKLEGDDPERPVLDDGIRAPHPIQDTTLFPGLWKIDGYTRIVEVLTAQTSLRVGHNFFALPYDWRRDNRASARLLARHAHDWLRAWRSRSGNPDAQMILMGHSMGGLVARYYLEVLGGWRDTRRLITFGTPYRGAIGPMKCITNGVDPGFGGLGGTLTRLVRSFTSVHQLIATWPCYDPGDGGLVRPGEATGIPNLDPARAAAGLAFHREIWDAVAQNRRDPLWEERGYQIHPVVGTRQHTPQSAAFDGARIRELDTIKGRRFDGDSSVPRASATPREIAGQGREIYVAGRHDTLQNQDVVLHHVIDLLAGDDAADALFFGDGGPVEVSLRLPDMVRPGDPIVAGIELMDEPEGEVVVAVEDTHTGQTLSRTTADLEPWSLTQVELPPPGVSGAMRVVVRGAITDDVQTTGGVLLSMDPEADPDAPS